MAEREVVFITGASSGFGEACARRFAAAGHPLVLTARRADRLAALKDSLSVPVHAIAADIRDRTAMRDAVRDLPPAFAEVGVLINNAGATRGLVPAHQRDLDDWDAMIDTNIRGLLLCTRLLLPGMVARDRGHIVNLGSPSADRPYPGGNIYASSKAFVRQFSFNLRSDLLGTKVRVSCIEPGLARTEIFEQRFGGDKARAEAMFDGVDPLTADDVAEAIQWCVARPPRVNINLVELMPVAQAFAALAVVRDSDQGRPPQ